MLSEDKGSEYLEDLQLVEDQCDELIQKLARPSGRPHEDFSFRYVGKADRLQRALTDVVRNAGIARMETLLSLLIPGWEQSSKDECRARIRGYSSFSLTGYMVVDFKEGPGGELVLVSREGGEESVVCAEDVEEERPFLTSFRFFRPRNLHEEVYGAELCYPRVNREGVYKCVVVRGVFLGSPADPSCCDASLYAKLENFKSVMVRNPAPEEFKNVFFESYSMRDFMLQNPKEFEDTLTGAYRRYQELSGKPAARIIETFGAATPLEQLQMLSLLLIAPNPEKAVSVFNAAARREEAKMRVLRDDLLPGNLCKKLIFHRDRLDRSSKDRLRGVRDVDLEAEIIASEWPDPVKAKALERLRYSKGSSSEAPKALAWVKGLLRVPVGVFSPALVDPLPADPTGGDRLRHSDAVKSCLERAEGILNGAVEGHDEGKRTFLRMLTRYLLNDGSAGTVIGIQGPPGNGKTTLAKAVAEVLGRPCFYIALGNIHDGCLMNGMCYTYVSATHGKIAEALMSSGTMDVVIIVDEVDKVRGDDRSQQVISSLMHVLDPSQNKEYEDNYFAGVRFDLSRVTWVLLWNDSSRIDRVLRDRIPEIKTEALTVEMKYGIVKKHFMPEMLREHAFEPGAVTIGNDVVDYIISNYATEAGARKLKACLVSIVGELALRASLAAMEYPVEITRELVRSCLSEPQGECLRRLDAPRIGQMQGLFANVEMGQGGLVTLQCTRTTSEFPLDLKITGSLGDMARQSAAVAREVAVNVLPPDVRQVILRERLFGLHLHVTRMGKTKEGSSAGVAMTVAMVSQLMKIAVRHNVAATGEVDAFGNCMAIGGLRYKLQGSKEAGINYVLVSNENLRDVEQIVREHPGLVTSVRHRSEVDSRELDAPIEGLHVIIVRTIQELLSCALVRGDIPFCSLLD